MRFPWLAEGVKHLGVKEIKGLPTAPTISRWLSELRAWWTDDETPWCGVFAAHCMKSAGVPLPKAWYRAKAWLDWGTYIAAPKVGAIVVFERQGGGHVGFVVGRNAAGMLLVLGGNQGDAVRVSAFDPNRVAGYRWPPGAWVAASGPLPVLTMPEAEVSRNEA